MEQTKFKYTLNSPATRLPLPTGSEFQNVMMPTAHVGCPSNKDCGIREVWHYNLEDEFNNIRKIVQKYKYVAVDTEYPGVVARPVGQFSCHTDFNYQYMRCNVNQLRVIQLGLCFMDEHGHRPPAHNAWQFNFKFDINKDMGACNSIALLMNSGFQFDKHKVDGIEPFEFAELLMSSGVVLVDDITFITFHSDFDFGYMLRVLTDSPLPEDKSEFLDLIGMFFPNIYDVKCLISSFPNFRCSGLQDLADILDVQRIGRAHQAASDAIMTAMVFLKMRQCCYNGGFPGDSCKGLIYGLSILKPVLEKGEKENAQKGSNNV